MKLSDIASAIGGVVWGDPDFQVSGIAPLESAGSTDVSFLLESRFVHQAHTTRAGAIITEKQLGIPLHQIGVKHPRKSLAQIVQLFYPDPEAVPGISKLAAVHASATISNSASVGEFTSIGAGVTIGDNTVILDKVSIGKNCQIGHHCRLFPNVVLYDNTVIGDHVTLHAGSVIGSDGFGYYPENGAWHKIKHIGRVVLGNHVEIGANTTIDRGCLGDTVISDGCKIDNLVQIGHNNRWGAHCVMASQVGVAGSVEAGAHVMVGGQAGIKDHVTIGSNVIIMARSGVTKSVESGIVSGFPAQSHRQEMAQRAKLKKLIEKE